MPTDEQPIPSVWTRPRRGREQPALSRGQIVSEAVLLLDTEGLGALSMRRLGTRLGSGATSLYRHVTNRDELIELVVDEVYGEVAVPDVAKPADWRAAVTAFAHTVRSTILRHPWMASLLGEVGLAYLGPNAMRLNDRMLAMFEVAGFALDEAYLAVNAVASYVIGRGVSEAAWLTTLARSGQDVTDWEERLRPAAERAAQPYPRLREVFAAQGKLDLRQAREDNFAYGLDRMLDGLQAKLLP